MLPGVSFSSALCLELLTVLKIYRIAGRVDDLIFFGKSTDERVDRLVTGDLPSDD